jgi:hypothetical protein
LFIVHLSSAEVLHYTGVVEELPGLSKDQSDMLNNLKVTTIRHAEKFRVQVRRRLNPNNVQAFVDKERMAAIGLASGAFVGVLL